MALTPVTITTPLRLPLTQAYLSSQSRAPLIIGTLWRLRLQVRDEDNAAYSVSGATIVMTLTRGSTSITRHTGTTTSGASAAQVVLDADQAAENTTLFTGKGWFEIRFDAVAADITSLTTIAGKGGSYEVAIKFGDATTQIVFVAGELDVLTPANTFPLT